MPPLLPPLTPQLLSLYLYCYRYCYYNGHYHNWARQYQRHSARVSIMTSFSFRSRNKDGAPGGYARARLLTIPGPRLGQGVRGGPQRASYSSTWAQQAWLRRARAYLSLTATLPVKRAPRATFLGEPLPEPLPAARGQKRRHRPARTARHRAKTQGGRTDTGTDGQTGK